MLEHSTKKGEGRNREKGLSAFPFLPYPTLLHFSLTKLQKNQLQEWGGGKRPVGEYFWGKTPISPEDLCELILRSAFCLPVLYWLGCYRTIQDKKNPFPKGGIPEKGRAAQKRSSCFTKSRLLKVSIETNNLLSISSVLCMNVSPMQNRQKTKVFNVVVAVKNHWTFRPCSHKRSCHVRD